MRPKLHLLLPYRHQTSSRLTKILTTSLSDASSTVALRRGPRPASRCRTMKYFSEDDYRCRTDVSPLSRLY